MDGKHVVVEAEDDLFKPENLRTPLKAFSEWKHWHTKEVLDQELHEFTEHGRVVPTDRQFMDTEFSLVPNKLVTCCTM